MVATALLSDDRIGLAGALYGAVNQEVATYEDGPSVSKHKIDGDVSLDTPASRVS